MWLDYAEAIEEPADKLLATEKRLRGLPLQSRLRMPRLLKSEGLPQSL